MEDKNLCSNCASLKGGPSDLGTKNFTKLQKNHPYTLKDF